MYKKHYIKHDIELMFYIFMGVGKSINLLKFIFSTIYTHLMAEATKVSFNGLLSISFCLNVEVTQQLKIQK